jgi:hypothetical protein
MGHDIEFTVGPPDELGAQDEELLETGRPRRSRFDPMAAPPAVRVGLLAVAAAALVIGYLRSAHSDQAPSAAPSTPRPTVASSPSQGFGFVNERYDGAYAPGRPQADAREALATGSCTAALDCTTGPMDPAQLALVTAPFGALARSSGAVVRDSGGHVAFESVEAMTAGGTLLHLLVQQSPFVPAMDPVEQGQLPDQLQIDTIRAGWRYTVTLVGASDGDAVRTVALAGETWAQTQAPPS